MTPTQLSYDGHEEDGDPDTEYITGGGGGGSTDVDLDDLEVYEPAVVDNEISVFYEGSASQGNVTCWVWNSSTNFTGGSWPGENATLMGKTADGTRKSYKWPFDGTSDALPTGLIFSNNGNSQTDDLEFVNHGYYINGKYDHTVTNSTAPDPDMPALTVTPAGGKFTDEVKVTVTASKSDAVIVYTTNGDKPTAASTQAVGSVSLNFTKSTTLRAGILMNGEVKNLVSYTFTIQSSTAQKLCAYFIAPNEWTNVYCYAWNADLGNKTYTSNWPGQLCTVYGTTADGRTIWEWDGGPVGNDMPTGIIFNNNGGNGDNQTSDFTFINGQYYDRNGISGISDITAAGEPGVCNVYTIDGRLLKANVDTENATSGLARGIYIVGNKKVVVR